MSIQCTPYFPSISTQDATAKVKLHRTLLEAQAAVRQRNAAPLRPSAWCGILDSTQSAFRAKVGSQAGHRKPW
eukprot:scaffold14059_cov18-Tisochrysis_lutea.AAC.1